MSGGEGMAGAAAGARPRRRLPWRWIALGVALGLAIGIVLARKPGSDLSGEALAAARARWQQRGPAGYTLEIETRGAVADTKVIEVRDGEVVAMTTGGAAVPESAWSYWTVEGLFGFLDEEIANAARPQAAYGVDDPRQVVLRAAFDDEWGYPAFFLRHVLGKNRSVEWEVTRFEAR